MHGKRQVSVENSAVNVYEDENVPDWSAQIL